MATRELTLEVQDELGDNQVRCLALGSTDGLVRGAAVSSTGGPITVPVGEGTLGRIFNVLGETIDSDAPVEAAARWPIHRPPPALKYQEPTARVFETGIKVVNLMAPYTRGGKVGLFGGAGVGKTVLIESFAGLRPASDRTYRVEVSEQVDNLIQACGIRWTGVSASPAMGEYVHGLLRDAGLRSKPRPGAHQRVPRRPRLADALDGSSVSDDPLGRTVICACEKVTAREIHDALTAPLPARSIAGIAKRTRATWGRFQSACLSGVTFIASLYWDGPVWKLPMGEPSATLGVDEARRG